MLQHFLQEYLQVRPLFLSLIRAKEAELYQKYLPLKKPVLDIGCGDGYFVKTTCGYHEAVETPRRCANAHLRGGGDMIDVGIDLKESRINEAGKLGIYKKLLTYDGVNIPLHNNSFSTVVSNCVLEHVADLKTLLKEIRRVLKRDGIFLTTVMAKPWEDYLFGTKIFGRSYKDFMRKTQIHRNLLPKAEWDKAFENSGFKIVRTIGYLSPRACRLIDICHYLSLPCLVTYKLFGKWVVLPKLSTPLYPTQYLTQIMSKNVNPGQSGAIFYLLEK